MHWKNQIGFFLFLIVIIPSQGIFCQSNWSDSIIVNGERFTLERMYRNSAKEDLENGDTLIIRRGLIIFSPELNGLTKKYGFRFMGICTGSVEGYGYYNDEVIKSLSKRNGENWWEKFLEEKSKLKINSIKPLPKREKD